MSTSYSAIIIGGGIGGLAAGIALRHAGCRVQVFERAPAFREVGAGISLWPNALRALDVLGVGDVIRSHAVRTSGDLRTWTGRVLVEAASRSDAKMDPVCVHRADLQQALLEALGSGVVTLGADCTSVEEEPSSVMVRFSDGRSISGDFLIGADGLHSVVRARLFGQAPPRFAGYVAWRAVVEFDHRQLKPGETWGAGERFGHLPMSNGRVYWYAAKTGIEGERSAAGERTELRRIFEHWHAPIPQLIQATDDRAILRNDIYDRPPLPSWGRGHMSLLGDAAHPMTPNLGQGACQALEDAVVLGRAIADHASVPSAFRAYEAQRVDRANLIVTQSRQVGWIGQWRHPLAVALRNGLVRFGGSRLQARQLAPIVGHQI